MFLNWKIFGQTLDSKCTHSVSNKRYSYDYNAIPIPSAAILASTQSKCHENNDPDEYRPTCDSRVVDGIVRGLFYGIIWGFMFHPFPEFRRNSGVAEKIYRLKPYFQIVARDSWTIATFLGVYNGASCALEEVNGRKNVWNTSYALICAGSVLAAQTKNPNFVLYSATLTAVSSTWMYFYQWPKK
mmetsp:Transcript_33064/g.43526  ORF Transcript_33064/g.43526 Transcript_33064/m.43526 type:complete len:185 (+) Transcript_33064:77-631(+)